MRLRGPDEQPLTDEFDVICRALDLEGARVLELGCGAAEKTRQIASNGAASVVAAEVDATQHAKNLQADVPANIVFKAYGAEHIEEEDGSFDAVVMFYTIEHLPRTEHAAIYQKISKWLKPGGFFLISTEANEVEEAIGEWLGVPMYFSTFDPETVKKMVVASGLTIQETTIEIQREGDDEIPYLWVLAQKPMD